MFQGYVFAMTISLRGGGTPRGGEGFTMQVKVFGGELHFQGSPPADLD